MWNPVAQALLWASSGWTDNTHTSVMKRCDPDSSSWLTLATSVAFSELMSQILTFHVFIFYSIPVSLECVVIPIPEKKNQSRGKPRANPLRDSGIEIALQKPNFKRAHTYWNWQPYVVPSILGLHIEELGTAEWDSRKISGKARQPMGNA